MSPAIWSRSLSALLPSPYPRTNPRANPARLRAKVTAPMNGIPHRRRQGVREKSSIVEYNGLSVLIVVVVVLRHLQAFRGNVAAFHRGRRAGGDHGAIVFVSSSSSTSTRPNSNSVLTLCCKILLKSLSVGCNGSVHESEPYAKGVLSKIQREEIKFVVVCVPKPCKTALRL